MSNKRMRFSSNMTFVSQEDHNNITISNSSDGVSLEDLAVSNEQQQAIMLEESYQRGWSECKQAMNSTISSLQEQLGEVTCKLAGSISAYFCDLEEQLKVEVGNMAFAVAEAILKKEFDDKEQVMKSISEALSPVLNLNGLKIRLNPAIVEELNSGTDYGIPSGIELVSDATLQTAEAVVESPKGIIDATLAGRIGSLKESFKQNLAQ